VPLEALAVLVPQLQALELRALEDHVGRRLEIGGGVGKVHDDRADVCPLRVRGDPIPKLEGILPAEMVSDLGLLSLRINCDTPGKTSMEKWKSNTGLFPVSCFLLSQIDQNYSK
jgi:hypothetical protein